VAGAPKGNTNALKHGLYAKQYSPEEQKELRRMSFDDLQHEINAMRKVAPTKGNIALRVILPF
jgi:uncharacterized protein YjcR